MKVKLYGSIQFDNEDFIGNALIEGDEVDIVWVHQGCPDLGCCTIDVYIDYEGLIYKGRIYWCQLQPTSYPQELIKFTEYPFPYK